MVEPTITAIVIDDDLDTVELFCEHLELKGIQVIGKGYNGKEAVELYQNIICKLTCYSNLRIVVIMASNSYGL